MVRRRLAAAAALALVFAAGLSVSVGSTDARPCWAKHGTCPTVTTTPSTATATSTATSTTAPTTTTTTAATTTASATTTTVATPTPGCALYASPAGSDANPGTLAAPLATVGALGRALAPGQTGCLRGGTYGSTSTETDLANDGTAASRITITAYPGEVPLVRGWINVTGAYTTVSGLRIDGSNTFYTASRSGCSAPVSQGLVIAGAGDVLEYNDVFQSVASLRGNGIGIGWWGRPDGAIVRYNRIHDVGGCQAYDHLIYLAHGDGVRIYGNWMWNDAHGWGVQMYPGVTNARVYANVIDRAGAGFVISDNGTATTTGNQVFHNIVANSVGVPSPANVAGACIGGYPPVAGSNNRFDSNDCWQNPGGIGSQTNVAASGNIVADPLFAAAAAHDYGVSPASPAASWGVWDGRAG